MYINHIFKLPIDIKKNKKNLNMYINNKINYTWIKIRKVLIEALYNNDFFFVKNKSFILKTWLLITCATKIFAIYLVKS
jgi:hypothetical protein